MKQLFSICLLSFLYFSIHYCYTIERVNPEDAERLSINDFMNYAMASPPNDGDNVGSAAFLFGPRLGKRSNSHNPGENFIEVPTKNYRKVDDINSANAALLVFQGKTNPYTAIMSPRPGRNVDTDPPARARPPFAPRLGKKSTDFLYNTKFGHLLNR